MLGSSARPWSVVAALALAAGLVGAVPVAAAEQEQQVLTASAEAPDRGVRDGRPLVFKGQAADSRPVDVVVRALSATGALITTQSFSEFVYRPDATQEFVRNDDGRISGRLGLNCIFGAPDDPNDPQGGGPSQFCPFPHGQARSAQVQLTLANGDVLVSQPVPVDFTFPTIRRYEVTAPGTITVYFSEPVRHDEGDSPSDWTVTEPRAIVTAVEEPTDATCSPAADDPRLGDDHCRRVLRVTGLPEDAEPRVEYAAGINRLGRVYEDFTGNGFDRSDATGAGARGTAEDLVRPAAPTIRRVGGRVPSGSPAGTAGTQRSPQVELSGLTPGHTALVRVTGPVTFTAGPVTAGDDGTAVVPVEGLPGSGAYQFRAEARDRNQLSSVDDRSRTPARADGSPELVEYRLDLELPDLLDATTDGSALLVRFSEAVTGPDRAQDWTVDGRRDVVTGVSGSGRDRRLTTTQPVAEGAVLVYDPQAEPQYSDEAGNPVGRRSTLVDGLDVPLVTSPATLTYTSASSFPVRGTAEPGSVVEVFRDANDDGVAEGEVFSDVLGATETAFEVVVQLPEDGDYDFVARTRAAEGSPRTSGTRRVPRLVQDDTRPELTVQRPAEGEVLAGDRDVEIRFSLAERNPGPGPVRVEFSPDGGATYRLVTAGTDRSFTWRTPDVSTERGVLRFTATDLAGNGLLQPVLRAVVVDALPPVFSASTQDARTVVVVFSEPVSGSSRQLDWRVDGEQVSAVEERLVDGRRVVVLTVGPRTTIGPDARPEVEYAPAALSSEYRDRAQQPVPLPARRVRALDGILPAAATVTAPSSAVLTRERSILVSGRAQPGTVEVLDARGRRTGPVPVADDGTWSLQVPLELDSTNELRVLARDTNGNRSLGTTAVPTIEQDASDPVVRVTEPVPGTRLAPGSRVAVRWTSSDRNLVERATTVQVSTDGGRTFTVLGQQQPASGSLTWDVPRTTTSNALVLVSTPDRAGRTGTGTSSPLGIGEEAQPPAGTGATASPSASSSASPSPLPSASLPPLPPVGTFTAVAPARLLDTREGTGARPGPLGPDGSLRLQVTGEGGLPRSGVQAVVLNVIAVQPTSSTHLSVVPSGRDQEGTASLTAARGVTTATMVTVRLGQDGAVDLRNEAGRTDVVADVLGWYAAPDGERGVGFAPLSPQRLLDTRSGLGAPRRPVVGGRPLELQVAGRGGVPASGVSSVVLNLTAVHPSAGTHVTAWAAGRARPETSNLNAQRRTTASNLVTVPVGRDGKVALETLSSGHLVADVFGWYGAPATDVLVPVDPARLEDTRPRREPLQAGGELVLRVAGRGGVPARGATAVVLTVTAVAPTRSTHLALYAGGSRTPETANLNAARGSTSTAQVIVPVGPDGTVRVRTGAGAVHVVADVAGWFRKG